MEEGTRTRSRGYAGFRSPSLARYGDREMVEPVGCGSLYTTGAVVLGVVLDRVSWAAGYISGVVAADGVDMTVVAGAVEDVWEDVGSTAGELAVAAAAVAAVGRAWTRRREERQGRCCCR